jgi:hypothetical protein
VATITTVLPDNLNAQLVEAVCGEYGYQPIIPNGSGLMIPNPVSSGVFTQTIFMNFGKEIIKAYLTKKGVEQTRQSIASQIDSTFNQAVITINVQ